VVPRRGGGGGAGEEEEGGEEVSVEVEGHFGKVGYNFNVLTE
jgi:hypothetical protein